MIRFIVLILSISGLACAEPDDRAAPADQAAPAGSSSDGAEADPDRPVCLEGDRFVADGAVQVAPPAGGDATQVSALRWSRHEGCERFVIDLADEDGEAATSPGVVSADVLREMGVVRIELREVEWVDPEATEARFDGDLARGAYAVWSPDGRWTFVDLHLGEAAEARVLVLDEPARVVVDLRPGGRPVPPAPVVGDRVVVLEPRSGPVSYPLTVTGYARTFEANVVVRVEQGGEEVQDTFTTATAWADAWGHYSVTINDGPSGTMELHVGEHSARDGTWQGVELELEVR